jgi:hypothetical protein
MDVGLPEFTMVVIIIILLFGSALLLRIWRGVVKRRQIEKRRKG